MSSPVKAIDINPDVLSDTPMFVGARVPVQTLFDYFLEGGETFDEFIKQFPAVSREQPLAALDLARENRLASTHSA